MIELVWIGQCRFFSQLWKYLLATERDKKKADVCCTDLDSRLVFLVEIGLHFAIDLADDLVQRRLDVLLFDFLCRRVRGEWLVRRWRARGRHRRRRLNVARVRRRRDRRRRGARVYFRVDARHFFDRFGHAVHLHLHRGRRCRMLRRRRVKGKHQPRPFRSTRD